MMMPKKRLISGTFAFYRHERSSRGDPELMKPWCAPDGLRAPARLLAARHAAVFERNASIAGLAVGTFEAQDGYLPALQRVTTKIRAFLSWTWRET